MKILKRSLLCVLCLFSSFFTIAQDTGGFRDEDGIQWMSRRASSKNDYLWGFISGSSIMREEALSGPRSLQEKGEYEKAATLIKNVSKRSLEISDNLALYDIAVGQLAEGLDTFYADFATKRIKIIDALYVVKMQIQGKQPDLIAAQIRFLKMQPISFTDIEPVINKLIGIKDYSEALKVGKVTEDELMKLRLFIDNSGKHNLLFLYGKY